MEYLSSLAFHTALLTRTVSRTVWNTNDDRYFEFEYFYEKKKLFENYVETDFLILLNFRKCGHISI